MVDLPIGCATLSKENAHDKQIADHHDNGDGQSDPGGRTHAFPFQSSVAPDFLRTPPHLIFCSIREKLRARCSWGKKFTHRNQVYASLARKCSAFAENCLDGPLSIEDRPAVNRP
jgi:hypothetical protein